MLTVQDVNNTFAEKGIYIKLPLPESFQVKAIDVLERKSTRDGLGLLLSVRYVNEEGKEASDLFFCEGKLDDRYRTRREPSEMAPPPKSDMLPHRTVEEFESEEDCLAYMAQAISHLLADKGYQPAECQDAELCFENNGRRYFINLAVRCDDAALEKAKALAALREQQGVDHEYALVVPAFQESLGVSLLQHDRWMWRNEEYLAANRVALYAVDNWNPNLVYGFVIYPKERELKRYFMTTGSQWQMVRQRYVAGRAHRRREKDE